MGIVSEMTEFSLSSTFLAGIRVLEVADEHGEYCGKILAGLGADVIKVEPPGGEPTRAYGPFYRDEPHPDRSLYFWHYNFAKRSIVLDLDVPDGQQEFHRLALGADVVIDGRERGYLDARGLGYQKLRAENNGLVVSRISPFGDDGPWAHYKASDLIHLALGGVMMNCGYDPEPSGAYDTPPIAPQMWHAYHIAGEMAAIGILGALNYRVASGKGQYLSTAVHDAVSKNTETDLPNWVYMRATHYRQTCRHSRPVSTAPGIALTKDGRYLFPYSTYLPGFVSSVVSIVRVLKRHGMELDLEDKKYYEPNRMLELLPSLHVANAVDRMINRYQYDRELWREAQAEGLAWAPVRRPEENLAEEHWAMRETFSKVEHPELRKEFSEIGAKWLAPEVPWVKGPRAPLLGEHTESVLRSKSPWRMPIAKPASDAVVAAHPALSPHGKPFALSGVRVLDLSWLLASGGAGRFLSALGAEVIKVEHQSRPDTMRWGPGWAPVGGRAEREAASAPMATPLPESPNRAGSFLEINSGKRSLGLNLKTAEGKRLLESLLMNSDIVIEGFSPGTMERMGFSYERMRELNPSIIYVQQSGMGQLGTYGSLRSYGPTAQAFAGTSEMSGLPDPWPPAGIGYSYLDWYGAYNMALAMLAALYRRQATGHGCYIDSSQVETGTYLTGTAILDYSANGRSWKRTGNRSPSKLAAPHGAFRASGEDRWIAIACFTEQEWHDLTDVLKVSELTTDPRFMTLEDRLANQDSLEELIEAQTIGWERYALMAALQDARVPAGVCQTAQDRVEDDPQLRHLEWLVELPQTEVGTWPVKEMATKYSETPSFIGGITGRSGPNYAEDTEYVLGNILGLSNEEIRKMVDLGVVDLPDNA